MESLAKERRRHSNIVWVLGFLFVIITPLIVQSFIGQDKGYLRENASRPEFPKVDIHSYKTFPKRLENWYMNSFGLRSTFVDSYEWIVYDLFGSKKIFKQVVGKDSILFGMQYINDYLKPNVFTDNELNKAVNLLNSYQAYFDSVGIKFAVVVAPNKCKVLSKYLPEGLNPIYPEGNVGLLQKALKESKSKVKLLYLGDTLNYSNLSPLPYQRYDTHWNDYGAFIGYNYLFNNLKELHKIPFSKTEKNYQFKLKQISYGDLGRSTKTFSQGSNLEPVYLKQEKIDSFPYPNKIYPEPTNFFFKKNYFRVHNSGDTSKPSILIFRDSFSTHLYQYFKQDFNRVAMIWRFDIQYDMVEEMKPDIVILEVVEISLDHALLGESHNVF